MKTNKRKTAKRNNILKISGAVAAIASGAAGIAIAVSKCTKKKAYEDSLNDVKTSEELL